MIYAPTDINPLVGGTRIWARSLVADRYLDLPRPDDKSGNTDWRRISCDRISKGTTQPALKIAAHKELISKYQKSGQPFALVRATQMSRLLLNMANSVMENGGTSLDRISGLPTIPGSAIKGIARREAIQFLKFCDEEDKIDWLFSIAMAFGWGPNDWSTKSDFCWAAGQQWEQISKSAQKLIIDELECPLGKFPVAFQGRFYFLPAFPDSAPAVVSDIVNCHHPKYYEAKYSPNNPVIATDDDDPRPIVFPAIEAGQTWCFPILASPKENEGTLADIVSFLNAALQQGIGAKTAAGYGIFKPENCEKPAIARSQLTLKLRFVTPCMCAGANQTKAELRAPSFRGELRWWFRALGATREQELEVFGGIAKSGDNSKAKSSALILQTKEIQRGNPNWQKAASPQFKPFLCDPNRPESYLWHFAAVASSSKDQPKAKEDRLWKTGRKSGIPNTEGSIPPDYEFEITRYLRRDLGAETKQLLDEAWNAFRCFGAVGLRSTRGMGSWLNTSGEDYQSTIELLQRRGFEVVLSNKRFGSWKEAVSYVGAWLKNDLRKKYPLGKSMPQKLTPLGSCSPRVTSAVRFRILRLNGSCYAPLAFEAPHVRVLPKEARRTPAVLAQPGVLCNEAPQDTAPKQRWKSC